MTVQEIAKELPNVEVKLLRNIVFRLGKHRRLKKHGRGRYSYESEGQEVLEVQ